MYIDNVDRTDCKTYGCKYYVEGADTCSSPQFIKAVEKNKGSDRYVYGRIAGGTGSDCDWKVPRKEEDVIQPKKKHNMSMLDWLNAQAAMKDLTREKLGEIMKSGTEEERLKALDAMNQAGGYECLV